MEINRQQSFLKLKVIWKDSDMFQLSVRATNGRYGGTTEVYDTPVSLANFARSLVHYPNGQKTLFHKVGEKDSYAYFAMKFYPIGRSGRDGVELHLEECVATEYRPEEKAKVKLELIVEPAAIDNFQKELIQLAINEKGMATLYGHNHSI